MKRAGITDAELDVFVAVLEERKLRYADDVRKCSDKGDRMGVHTNTARMCCVGCVLSDIAAMLGRGRRATGTGGR